MLIFVGHSYQGYTKPEEHIPRFRALEAEYPVTFHFAHEALQGDHLLGDIRGLIDSAAACIFDMTGQSRNVMIEYGMAVALQKPQMMLVRMGESEPVPAMLEGLRFKEYWFAETLQGHVRSFLDEQVSHNAHSELDTMKRKALAFIGQNEGVSIFQLNQALQIDTSIAGGLLKSLQASHEISMLPNTHRYVLN